MRMTSLPSIHPAESFFIIEIEQRRKCFINFKKDLIRSERVLHPRSPDSASCIPHLSIESAAAHSLSIVHQHLGGGGSLDERKRNLNKLLADYNIEEGRTAPMKSERTVWKCEVCGYESETAHAPEECPMCHHQQFAIVKRWKCQVCGFVIRDTRPPEECPICHKGSEAFAEIPSHPEF